MKIKQVFIIKVVSSFTSFLLLFLLLNIYISDGSKYLMLSDSQYKITALEKSKVDDIDLMIYKMLGPVVVGENKVYVLRIGLKNLVPAILNWFIIFLAVDLAVFLLLCYFVIKNKEKKEIDSIKSF